MDLIIETVRKYKIAFIGLVGFVALFVIYTIFFKGGGEAAPSDLVTVSPESSEIEAVTVDLLALLLSLKTITIDTGIFSDDRFRSLTDFSVELIQQPRGRPNPFLPTSGSGGSAFSPPSPPAPRTGVRPGGL